MKIQGAQVERFLARRDPAIAAILVYGPDEGLVRERVERLLERDLADRSDPFALADLGLDAVRGDPARLADEARSPSLMGGHRVVRLRQATDQATAACKTLLGLSGLDATVVVEGGDLPPSSSLRKLFEAAKNAAAVPCYHDQGRDLAAVVDTFLAEHGLDAEPDARRHLLDHLGSDRGVTRAELERLALYVVPPETEGPAPRTRLALEQVTAVIGDTSALGIDDLVDAVATGDLRPIGHYLDRLFAEGQHPVRIVRSAQNHFARLRQLAIRTEAGEPLEQVIGQARPPVHFRRRDKVKTALRQWREADAIAAMGFLLDTEIACKTTGRPAALLCRDAMYRLAAAARERL